MIICMFHCRLLEEKRKELGDAANKLKNGLSKIDETRAKVEAMSVELEDAKTKVAQFQKQCEEYLVVIVQQKREADEQQKVCYIHWFINNIVSLYWQGCTSSYYCVFIH